jgi:hypothetical protein
MLYDADELSGNKKFEGQEIHGPDFSKYKWNLV